MVEKTSKNSTKKLEQTALSHSRDLLLALSRAAQSIQRARTADEVYRAVGDQIKFLGGDVSLFMVERGGQFLTVVHTSYAQNFLQQVEKITGYSILGYRFELFPRGLFARSITDGRIIYVQDAKEYFAEMLPNIPRLLAIQSMNILNVEQGIFAPLRVDDETLGLMVVSGLSLTEDDVPAMKSFAGQIAVSLSNVRLAQQMQKELSERKLADEQLHKSEERYRTLFNSMTDGIYRSTHDGKFVDVNPAMVNMFGYSSREELLAVDIKKNLYFAPEDRSSPILDAVKEDVEVYRMRRKDGSEIWVEDRGHYVYDEQGAIVYHEGMLRDVTARIHAEKELRESESQLRVLFEQMAVGVARIQTQTGKFIQVNQKDCEIVGYSLQEMLSLNFQSITHPDDLQPDLDNMELLKSGVIREYTMEKRLIHKNGSIVWVDLTVSPMWQAGAAPDFHIAIVQDITARKKVEQTIQEREEQYRALIEQASDGIFLANQNGEYLDANSAGCELLGYSREEILHLTIHDVIKASPEDPLRLDELRNGKTLLTEREMIRKDGSLVSVEINTKQFPDGRYQGIVRDITARKQAEEQALLQSAALETAANAIAITDKKGVIQWVNPAWVTLTGYSKEESIGNNPRIIKSDEHDSTFYTNMWRTILSGKVWRGELVNRRKDGSLYFEEETITPVLDKQGNVKNFIAIKLNITKRKQAEADLQQAKEKLEAANRELKAAFEHEQHLAHTDVLTGVSNRRYVFELAIHEFDVARRYQQPLSVIMFDLDHFKYINDTFGHAVGDQMLQSVTQVVRAQLRDVDLIGRYGGEEFLIILPVTNAQHAWLLAERIRAGVAALCIDTDKGRPATVTLSIGIAETIHAPQDASVDELIHRADEAMYAAKQGGRNRTVIFGSDVSGAI